MSNEMDPEWTRLADVLNDAGKKGFNEARPRFGHTLAGILGVRDRADAGVVHLMRKVQALTERVAELERRPFTYDGPHEAGRVYDKGMFVTHDGSLWHCNYKTASRPGDGQAWTLAVKRGRDAR